MSAGKNGTAFLQGSERRHQGQSFSLQPRRCCRHSRERPGRLERRAGARKPRRFENLRKNPGRRPAALAELVSRISTTICNRRRTRYAAKDKAKPPRCWLTRCRFEEDAQGHDVTRDRRSRVREGSWSLRASAVLDSAAWRTVGPPRPESGTHFLRYARPPSMQKKKSIHWPPQK